MAERGESVTKFGQFFLKISSSIYLPILFTNLRKVMVAHFTPSSFPLVPIVDDNASSLCSLSWGKIIAQLVHVDRYSTISGMTAFYNEFYDRLQMFDSSGKFDAVLSRHSSGQNKIVAKGSIILRIVNFVVRIQGNSRTNDTVLRMLGESHSRKGIRPWQYSIFVQTLLNTISSRLGVDATSDVMEAWVNLFAFVMKGMLPAAIKGQVIATELNINTSVEYMPGNSRHLSRLDSDDRAQRRIVTFSTHVPNHVSSDAERIESKLPELSATSR